jgi:Fic family protein
MDTIPPLPILSENLQPNDPAILKQLVNSHRRLAELKGVLVSIPNQHILINTLWLQEAKDSSEIENIVTTEDELYQSDALHNDYITPASKEVYNYAAALKIGFEKVKQQGFIRLDDILAIQSALEENRAGLRALPGTKLLNPKTKEIVYVPPQNAQEIVTLMGNFVEHLNNAGDIDPLIQMAILHYQFESIHPFYDGNGRTGRILNLLHLTLNGLLDLPVLYLSRYIVRNKSEYYRLLQAVREKETWTEWILYMLEAVEKTAIETLHLVTSIRSQMLDIKHRLRKELPKLYSQDLINTLFSHPYTKIDFIMRDLQVSRITAMRYLGLLEKQKFLQKMKLGRTNFYVNTPLYQLLSTGSNSQG